MFLTHRDYRPRFAHDHRLCSAGCPATSTHLSLPATATLHVKIVILATAPYDGYAGVVSFTSSACALGPWTLM